MSLYLTIREIIMAKKGNEKVKTVKKKYQKLKRELARLWDKTTLPVIPFDLGL